MECEGKDVGQTNNHAGDQYFILRQVLPYYNRIPSEVVFLYQVLLLSILQDGR